MLADVMARIFSGFIGVRLGHASYLAASGYDSAGPCWRWLAGMFFCRGRRTFKNPARRILLNEDRRFCVSAADGACLEKERTVE